MMTQDWNVTIDRDRCIGSGMCVVYAPGTFDQDTTAKAVVREPADDDLDEVRAAVEACPTSALSLVTDEQGS